MTEHLEPCPNPWCTEPVAGPWVQRGETFAVVRCAGCGLKGPHAKDPGEARKLWNTRQRDPLLDEAREALAKIKRSIPQSIERGQTEGAVLWRDSLQSIGVACVNILAKLDAGR